MRALPILGRRRYASGSCLDRCGSAGNVETEELMEAWRMERSRNPGEHKPRIVEARTAWPVGISQAHRRPWSGGGDGMVTASKTARIVEECPKGNEE